MKKSKDHFDDYPPTKTPIRTTRAFAAPWFEVFNGPQRENSHLIWARSLQLKLGNPSD